MYVDYFIIIVNVQVLECEFCVRVSFHICYIYCGCLCNFFHLWCICLRECFECDGNGTCPV